MRRTAVRAIKATRVVVYAALLLTLICAGGWYAAQAREGSSARAELEGHWRDSYPPRAPAAFQPGDVVGRIVVPRIGLDAPLVEMADVDDRENLNKGPAHLAGSALPGQAGNCVIAGHRTTYTRPFFHLEMIEPGDEVILIDLARISHEYRVLEVLIVEPGDVWVMQPTPEPGVTLIACHPLFSASKRIVVRAGLEV
jgi:sortase A